MAKIISLDEGWDQEIKAKAIDVLEDILDNGLDQEKKCFKPGELMPIYTYCCKTSACSFIAFVHCVLVYFV